MAFTSYSDIHDPEVLKRLVGQEWANEARMVRATGIVDRDTRPVKSTTVQEIRQTLFQDTSGQVVAAGGSIASQKETQTISKHPVCWRYNSAEQPDVIEEIKEKDIPMENASMADGIRKASMQYLDNSIVEVIKATGGALTSNQSDQSASVVTLQALLKGKEVLTENGLSLDGGAMAMRSEVYWKLAALGLVAATSNTYGNNLQDQMVREGAMPTNILGLTPILSDKFTSLGSNQYYVYFIGQTSLRIGGDAVPAIEVAKQTVNKKFGTVTNFKINYAIGFKGVTYGGTASERISDTDLGTSGNWTLSAANSNDVLLSRVKIKTA
jgi:hypothetical protein